MSIQNLLDTYRESLVTLRKLAALETREKAEHKALVVSYEARIAELEEEQREQK